MSKRLTIILSETEMQALFKQASKDCRRPQDEARYIIRDHLFGDASKNNTGSQLSQGRRAGVVESTNQR